ncbi:peroxiredoxin [Autumnicola musiva]|uniref:thioredoxin-dependent peroxiredoxin n=1 Tax=Autumnicola musiva TaxID=3075589 RepID=A0ABU3D5C5_9FLAO|nr:peroxiredoxin [Zunongwangia sp. F117]MDT0676738.1 peroxiredoxin [Zunongwangia sp. F117]
MSLKIGDSIPDLELKDQNGKIFNFSSLNGVQPFVVYFYPRDFTPGCTKQACSFRDQYEEFRELGAEVIGISSDSEDSHARFVKKYDLPFIILSDEDQKARELFGVKPNLLGMVPGRETFIFDLQGMLKYRFNSMNAKRHIPEALTALENIK